MIRPYRHGDAPALFRIFYDSVHGLAGDCYSPRQLDAWAPADFDPVEWAARLDRLQPFVAERNNLPVGYADLQADGLIDHFFIAADAAGQGVGHHLMQHLLQQANARGQCRLYADVSLTAHPFFARQGFTVLQRRTVELRGERLDNLRMQKILSARAGDAVVSTPT